MSREDTTVYDHVSSVLLCVAAALGVSGAGYCGWKAINADGRIDYCMIELADGGVRLTGHIPWRHDRHIAFFPNPREAVAFAREQQCEVR